MKLFKISLLCLLVFSCSITKRRVLPGYHVNWGKSELSINKEDLKSVKYDSDFSDLNNKNEIQNISISTSTSICDTIFLLDGSSMLGKIISLDSKIIEYKSCQEESSFINKMYKSKIKSISFSNGIIYNIETEIEMKEKRKKLEKKHTETIKKTNTNGLTIDEENKIKYIKRSNNFTFILFLSLLATIFFLFFNSYLILISLLILIFTIIILFFIESKISKYDKISQKDKIFEKNGQNSIMLFLPTFISSILLYPFIVFAGFQIALLYISILFVVSTSSLYLAIKSLQIMSKNPDLYKSRRLILFFSFLESLIILITTFVTIIFLSGNLNFGS
jgi:hypothetical protein